MSHEAGVPKAFKATLVEHEDGTVTYRLESGGWPEERSVKRFIKKLGLEAVLDAVDLAVSKVWYDSNQATRYFYGVCHHAIRDAREPLSPQPAATPSPDDAMRDVWFEEGMEMGAHQEHHRLGKILKNWAELGYESLDDAVIGVWPED